MTLVMRLVDIARHGGRRSLIDTPEEISLAKDEVNWEIVKIVLFDSHFLFDSSRYSRDLAVLRDALQNLETNPSNKFQLNLGQARDFSVCSAENSRDCFRLLIPLDKQAFGVFPIYSGASRNDYLDYQVLSNSEWVQLISPLRSKSSEEERTHLSIVVDGFNQKFNPEDKAGPLGNFFGDRGQQDCVDESYSLFGFLHMLTEEGVLKYHKFNSNNMMAGMSFVHFAARIQGVDGSFVVDPWKGETEITRLARFEHDLKIQVHQIRGSKM